MSLVVLNDNDSFTQAIQIEVPVIRLEDVPIRREEVFENLFAIVVLKFGRDKLVFLFQLNFKGL